VTTLADQIRAELNGFDIGDPVTLPIAAVESVLDLHRPTTDQFGDPVCDWCSSHGCGCCRYTPKHVPDAAKDENGDVVRGDQTYPCAELLVIANAMGIKEEK
jgi:hypothetical protein